MTNKYESYDNKVTYEYVCEYFSDDGYEDIIENDFGNKRSEVWPPRFSFPDCNTRLGVRRYLANDMEGNQEVGYAYAGDIEFDTGQKIPQHLMRGLSQ